MGLLQGGNYKATTEEGGDLIYPLDTPQRITTSITRKFDSCNFSMDQLDLTFFGEDDLSFDTYLSCKYKWMIW